MEDSDNDSYNNYTADSRLLQISSFSSSGTEGESGPLFGIQAVKRVAFIQSPLVSTTTLLCFRIFAFLVHLCILVYFIYIFSKCISIFQVWVALDVFNSACEVLNFSLWNFVLSFIYFLVHVFQNMIFLITLYRPLSCPRVLYERWLKWWSLMISCLSVYFLSFLSPTWVRLENDMRVRRPLTCGLRATFNIFNMVMLVLIQSPMYLVMSYWTWALLQAFPLSLCVILLQYSLPSLHVATQGDTLILELIVLFVPFGAHFSTFLCSLSFAVHMCVSWLLSHAVRGADPFRI